MHKKILAILLSVLLLCSNQAGFIGASEAEGAAPDTEDALVLKEETEPLLPEAPEFEEEELRMANAAEITSGNFKYTIHDDGTTATITGFAGTQSGDLIIPSTIDGYTVTAIGDSAFQWYTSFTGKLVIPDGVTSIGERAFYYCYRLTGELVIPDSVVSIGKEAFANCRGFTGDLVIPDRVTTIGASAFYACHGFAGDLVIGDSVTSIGYQAFYYCSGFTGDLVIPDSVTSIRDYAFYSCSGIDAAYFYGDIPSVWGDDAFANMAKDFTIYYVEGNTSGWTIPTWTSSSADVYNTKTFTPDLFYTLSGEITSYNPTLPTTIQLLQNGEIQYITTIAAEIGTGQVTQSFAIEDIARGTYDLVVNKIGHLTYTITGIVMDKDVDLTLATDEAYSEMKLMAGDINDDGMVNADDLNIVWNADNYNKKVAQAADPITDINGDGYVNSDDLNIVWNADNYNKNAEHSTFAY